MRQLNNEQARAVKHFSGPVLVLAGPGSGKTFTLVERIRYLIEVRGVAPNSILTITFSKKASVEMKTRFYDLIGEKFYPVTFGTFHSIFYNILKTYHNYTPDSILTPNEKIKYMKKTLRKLSVENAEAEDVCFDMLSKISAYKSTAGCHLNSDTPIQTNQHSAFNSDKNRHANQHSSLNSDKYRQANQHSSLNADKYTHTYQSVSSESVDSKEDDFFAKYITDIEKRNEFIEIYREYDRSCRINGKLDFDDMIVLCLKLLKENKEALKKWQSIFKYFLVDEFQDINDIQYEVLMLLAGDEKNIFAVGDDDQSIYGFRGSKPELMKRFLELDGCKVIDMYKNYRCAEDVITAAGCLVSNNKERIIKNQISCKDDKSGNVYTCSFVSEKEEADFVIKKLKELKADNGDIKDTAVLYRTEQCVSYLEEQLKLSGIIYQKAVKSGSFYDNDWVKDIIAYMKIAVNEYEISDVYRILNKPERGISRENVRNIDAYIGSIDIYNEEAADDKEESTADSGIINIYNSDADKNAYNYSHEIGDIFSLLSEIRYISNMTCFAAVNYILKGLGYYRYLLKENIKLGKSRESVDEMTEELFMRARNFSNVKYWLDHIEYFTEADNGNIQTKNTQSKNTQSKNTHPKNSQPEHTENNLILQTAHSSKGLEYENVFIIGLTEGLFPHHKAKTDSETEEERRLMYVAMTRAKKNLYILGRGEKNHGKRVSRFVEEIKTCGKTEDIKV